MVADNIDGPGVVSGRGQGGYYFEITGTADWQELDFEGHTMTSYLVINDTANAADLSWDPEGPLLGTGSKSKHGEIRDSEQLKFERRSAKKMFVKNTGGSAATVRVMAW